MVRRSASESSTRTRCTDAVAGSGSGADGARSDREADDPHPAVAAAHEAAGALRAAHDRRREVETRIEAAGEGQVESAADAYRRAVRVLDGYEDSATGTGDFRAYVEFEAKISAVAEELDDDALAADAFEAAIEAVTKRRLSAGDFEAAREALAPAREYVDLLEERDDAADAVRAARREAQDALDALDDRIDDLERIAALGDADLDAPVDRLRDPIEGYNDAIRAAFDRYRRAASARDLFGFLETTQQYPLVPFDPPPADLQGYAATHDAGTEPLATLLEYADYSPSKLDHYVDDPGALRTAVAVHRTYLDRLDAAPLTVDWPPPPADVLRFRIRELIPLADRLTADPAPEAIVLLRDLRSLTRRDDYDRLRLAARAAAELTAAEREKLAAGEIRPALDRARAAREELRAALDGDGG